MRVPTGKGFQIDLEALEAALTPRTRAVLVNSPNNPTGVVYPESALRALGECLRAASKRLGRPILLVSDEPYRNLVFDGVSVPWLPALYEHTVLITSHSKDLGLAGERIGYAAVSPDCADAEVLGEALVLANRILGFVNAPALFQRVLPQVRPRPGDALYYQRLRDRLLPALRGMGLECVTPQGAFYLFPKSPIPDDVAFVKAALEEGLLLVPGSGFAGPGHFRISLSVPEEVVERAIPKFEKVLRNYR